VKKGSQFSPDERINWLRSTPFFLSHVAPFAAIFTDIAAGDWIICLALFWTRMFCITAGYHRYFSHRSYKLGRPLQFLLALGATTSMQKGPLWWAANHRHHHRYSDEPQDVHSPKRGFWWSHVGWILCDKFFSTKMDQIPDFAKFPELRWLDRYCLVPPLTLAAIIGLLGGWSALWIGFFLSTVMLWHATFTVNSLAHVFGRRRYATTDTSRNSLLIGLLTMGEGWHNNHHHFQASANQGFFWWEIDVTFYVLNVLKWLGLARDLKKPPREALRRNLIKEGHRDIGMLGEWPSKAVEALSGATHQAAL
jgi:Fatty-acid desaturase